MKNRARGTEKKFVRQCNVYLSRKGNGALVVSTFNHGGLFAEKESGASKCSPNDPEALGALINAKLDECEYREHFDYSKRKKSDWPAYKASQSKTIKAFEVEYVWYTIRGANDHNIIFQLQSPELANNTQLISSFSSGTDLLRIGTLALDFHRFFQRVETIVLR